MTLSTDALRKIVSEADQSEWEVTLNVSGRLMIQPNGPRGLIATCSVGDDPESDMFKNGTLNALFIATFNPLRIAKMLAVIEAAQNVKSGSCGHGDTGRANCPLCIALSELESHA